MMLTPTVNSVQIPQLSSFFFTIDSCLQGRDAFQRSLSNLQSSCVQSLKSLTPVFLTPKLVVFLDHTVSQKNKIKTIIVITIYIYQVFILW